MSDSLFGVIADSLERCKNNDCFNCKYAEKDSMGVSCKTQLRIDTRRLINALEEALLDIDNKYD